MTGTEPDAGPQSAALAGIVDELYGGSLEEFVKRRNGFAGTARKDGDRELAQQIAALGKPSRSAHAVNLLVRDEPDAATDLGELGAQLRSAEQAGDGPGMRRLGTERRRLVDGLAQHALGLIGVDDPPAGLRDEVVTTLTATLADADVAAHVLSGSLVRPVRWEGFGSVPLGNITALPPRPGVQGARPGAAGSKAAGTKPASGREGRTACAAEQQERTAKKERAEREEREASARREAERRLAEDLAQARTDLDEADTALDAATDRLGDLEERIRELESELSDTQHEVERARVELRRAKTRQREAKRDVDRLEDR